MSLLLSSCVVSAEYSSESPTVFTSSGESFEYVSDVKTELDRLRPELFAQMSEKIILTLLKKSKIRDLTNVKVDASNFSEISSNNNLDSDVQFRYRGDIENIKFQAFDRNGNPFYGQVTLAISLHVGHEYNTGTRTSENLSLYYKASDYLVTRKILSVFNKAGQEVYSEHGTSRKKCDRIRKKALIIFQEEF